MSIVALLGSPSPAALTPLEHAKYAISAGRLHQARTMIAKAIEGGVSGYEVERATADLEYAAGNCSIALARYSTLLGTAPDKERVLERAGIAALSCGKNNEASTLLTEAASSAKPSSNVWNALGVLADRQRNWPAADVAYAKALDLDPANAATLNNLGWSLALRGRWADALKYLEAAASHTPKSDRIVTNLELARAANDPGLPERKSEESDESWAARLNDAGVVAYMQGNSKKAKAALSQALELRSHWFDRASNNLDLVHGSE